jgi:hypothetical protein
MAAAMGNKNKALVLYNAAHTNSSIKSEDGKAWIRILGFFASREDALAHASKLNEHVKQEIRLAPLGSFRVLLKDKLTPELREKETQKHSFLLATHAKVRSYAIRQTQENADLRKMAGSTSYDLGANAPLDQDSPAIAIEATKPVSKDTQNLPAVSRDNEIRMQRFAAISVIPDYEILGIRARRKVANTLKSQREYTIKKNEIISKKIKEGFVLPSFIKLVNSFIQANPPPPHYDIQGKRLDNDDDNEPNSEISHWMKMRNDAIEVALFEAMGVEKPALEEALEEKGEEGEEEPAVMFLDFADREDEMETKIQKIVDTDVSMKHYDIACVSMYEWLCLETLSQTPVKYRDPHLNNLHKARLAHSEEASSLIEAGTAKVIELGLK